MEEKIERPIMTEDELKEYIKAGSLRLFDAVRKFKSVKRAIRRGHVSPIGGVLPRRPYNNRKSTECRYLNKVKRGIYARLK